MFVFVLCTWWEKSGKDSVFLRNFITGDSKIRKWCWWFSAQFKGTVWVQTDWSLRLEICSHKLEKKEKKPPSSSQLCWLPTDWFLSLLSLRTVKIFSSPLLMGILTPPKSPLPLSLLSAWPDVYKIPIVSFTFMDIQYVSFMILGDVREAKRNTAFPSFLCTLF